MHIEIQFEVLFACQHLQMVTPNFRRYECIHHTEHGWGLWGNVVQNGVVG